VSKKIKIGDYFAKLQARAWLPRAQSAQDNHALACNFAKDKFKKNRSHTQQ